MLRDSPSVSSASSETGSANEAKKAADQAVMEATVKLLYYLVLQVVTRSDIDGAASSDGTSMFGDRSTSDFGEATSGERSTSDDSIGDSDDSDTEDDENSSLSDLLSITLSSQVLPSSPIKLRHAVSGAESLSDSIFEVLLPSFSQAVDRLVAIGLSSAPAAAALDSHQSSPISATERDTFIVHEIVTLLSTCARRSPNCRRILSKPAWVTKFLKLCSFGPSMLTQQWSLRILATLLPNTNLAKYSDSKIGGHNDVHAEHVAELRTFLHSTLSDNASGSFGERSLIEGIVLLLMKVCADSCESTLFINCCPQLANGASPVRKNSFYTHHKDRKYQHISAQSESIMVLHALHASQGWRAAVESALSAHLDGVVDHLRLNGLSADDKLSSYARAHATFNMLGGLPCVFYPGCMVKFVCPQAADCRERSGVCLSIKSDGSELTALLDNSEGTPSTQTVPMDLVLRDQMSVKKSFFRKISSAIKMQIVNAFVYAFADKELPAPDCVEHFMYRNLLLPALSRCIITFLVDDCGFTNELLTGSLLSSLEDFNSILKIATTPMQKCSNGAGDVVVFEQCYELWLNKIVELSSAVGSDETAAEGVESKKKGHVQFGGDQKKVEDIAQNKKEANDSKSRRYGSDLVGEEEEEEESLSLSWDEVMNTVVVADSATGIQTKKLTVLNEGNSGNDNDDDDDDDSVPDIVEDIVFTPHVNDVDKESDQEADNEEEDGDEDMETGTESEPNDSGPSDEELLAHIDQIQEIYPHVTAAQARYVLRNADYDVEMAIGLIVSVNTIEELAPAQLVEQHEAERAARIERLNQKKKIREEKKTLRGAPVIKQQALPTEQAQATASLLGQLAAQMTQLTASTAAQPSAAPAASPSTKPLSLFERVALSQQQSGDSSQQKAQSPQNKKDSFSSFKSFLDFQRQREEEQQREREREKELAEKENDVTKLCTRREHNNFTLIYSETSMESTITGTLFPGEQVHLYPGFDIKKDIVVDKADNKNYQWIKIQTNKYPDLVVPSASVSTEALTTQEDGPGPVGWIRLKSHGIELVNYEYSPGSERFHNIPAGVVPREYSSYRIIASGGASVLKSIPGQGSLTAATAFASANVLQTLPENAIVSSFEDGVDIEGSLYLHVIIMSTSNDKTKSSVVGWVRKKNGNKFLVEKCDCSADQQSLKWIPEIELLKISKDYLDMNILTSANTSAGTKSSSSERNEAASRRELVQRARIASYHSMFATTTRAGLTRAIESIEASAAGVIGGSSTVHAILSEGTELYIRQILVLIIARSMKAKEITATLMRKCLGPCSLSGSQQAARCTQFNRFIQLMCFRQFWIDDIVGQKAVQKLLLSESACVGLNSTFVLSENLFGSFLCNYFSSIAQVGHEASSDFASCKLLLECLVNSVAQFLRSLLSRNLSGTSNSGDEDFDFEYMQWLTKILYGSTWGATAYRYELLDLCQIAAVALRSSAFHLRQFGVQFLTNFFEQMTTLADRELLTTVAQMVPLKKLTMLTKKLLQREMDNYPSFSIQLKGLLEIIAQGDANIETEAPQSETAAASGEVVPGMSKPKQRSAIQLRGDGSELRFQTMRDLRGPWTMECMLFRSSKENEVGESSARRSKDPQKPVATGGRHRFMQNIENNRPNASSSSSTAQTNERPRLFASKYLGSGGRGSGGRGSGGILLGSSDGNNADNKDRDSSAGGLFGSSPAPTNPFFLSSVSRQPAVGTPSGLFGSALSSSPVPVPGNSLFGSTSAPFLSSSTASGGLFGSPSTSNNNSTAGIRIGFGTASLSASPVFGTSLASTPPGATSTPTPPFGGFGSGPQEAATNSSFGSAAPQEVASISSTTQPSPRGMFDSPFNPSPTSSLPPSRAISSESTGNGDPAAIDVDPIVLCWSPTSVVYLQAGGKRWVSKQNESTEPAADADEDVTVHDETLCLGVSPTADPTALSYKSPLTFNFIVPKDMWVHLVLSYDPHNKKLKLIVDGKLVDEISFSVDFRFPMVSIGDPKINPIYQQHMMKAMSKGAVKVANLKGFKGMLSGFTVWRCTKSVEDIIESRKQYLLPGSSAASVRSLSALGELEVAYKLSEGDGDKCYSGGPDTALVYCENDKSGADSSTGCWTTIDDPIEVPAETLRTISDDTTSSGVVRTSYNSGGLYNDDVMTDSTLDIDCPAVVTFEDSKVGTETIHLALVKSSVTVGDMENELPMEFVNGFDVLSGTVTWSKRGLISKINRGRTSLDGGRIEFSLDPFSTKAINVSSGKGSTTTKTTTTSLSSSPDSISGVFGGPVSAWMGRGMRFVGTRDPVDGSISGTLTANKKKAINAKKAQLGNKSEVEVPLEPGQVRIDASNLLPGSHQMSTEGSGVLLTSTGSMDSMITVKICPNVNHQQFASVFALPEELNNNDVTGEQLLNAFRDEANYVKVSDTVSTTDEANAASKSNNYSSVPTSKAAGALSRFAKMLKLGIPAEAVRNKMSTEGISEADINGFFDAHGTTPTNPSSANTATPQAFGICANQGSAWVEWEVRACSNRMVFGVTASEGAVQW
jgi:hypothetical protein